MRVIKRPRERRMGNIMIKALRRWSTLSVVPDDLASVTDTASGEVAEHTLGLRDGSVQALWQCFERLYATGVQPGLQLCVRHRGEVVIDRAIGHARGNEPGTSGSALVPMTVNTPINLFSAAKAVTAMLVHRMVEQGALSLDDPVASHLPGFERHGKAAITVRQILTHRAGLTRMPVLDDGDELDALHDDEKRRELVLSLRPQGRAGGLPAYHAITGGFVLAEMLRELTGQDPRALLQKWIKGPLGAQWLDYGLPADRADQIALNAATGWMPGPIAWQLSRVVGAPFAQAIAKSNDPRFQSAVIPSGNVVSTARDIARFYQCLLNGGEFDGQRMFAERTVQSAIRPDRQRASLDRVIGIPIRYSAGFMLGHGGVGLYGLNRYSTFGHLGLSSTLTWARPDTGSVVCLVTTGKPVLGPHIPEMLSMFSALNRFCENRLVR